MVWLSSESVVTNYLWDEASAYGDVVYEYNSNGSALANYVLAGTGLISQTRGATTNYFLQDGQGSTRGLTSSTTSAITDTYSYTAFGEAFATTGTTVNPYRYTGQQFDMSTGLYSLRARYYNPALGRFLSQDTYPVNFGNPIQLNRYAYTANNPVNAMDPSGYTLVEYSINLAKNIAVGAAIGGLINGGLDYALQYYTKGPHEIDVQQLLHATLTGAVIGGFSAAMGGTLGMLTEGDAMMTIAYGMIDGYYSGLLSRVVMNKLEGQHALAGYTLQTALTDIITGGAMAGLFHGSGAPTSCAANSFSADTEVASKDGGKPISEIKIGDFVLAWNEETGELSFERVTDTIHHTDKTIVKLTIDDETLTTTPEHPFYVESKGWVKAKDLKIGDSIHKADGSIGKVKKVKTEQSTREMYNLTVDEAHTFFVGDGQWLVHNACFGNAKSFNYQKTFFDAYPELEDQVVVHHAVEQQTLIHFPDVVTPEEIHSLENLRGIPINRNSDIHLSQIRKIWNNFYRRNPRPTQMDLLRQATLIDILFDEVFLP